MSTRIIANEVFYNSLCREAILVKETRLKYEAVGIDLLDWPDCAAKGVYRRFLSECDKSLGAAQYRAITDLNALGVEAVSKDYSFLAKKYEDEKEYMRGVYLARKINEDPKRWVTAVHDAKRSVHVRSEFVRLQDHVSKMIEAKVSEFAAGSAVLRIPSWPKLSDMIGGFNHSRVSIISAATGVGKTNLALNLAQSAASKMGVVYVNMEMDHADIGLRLFTAKKRISQTGLRSLTPESITRATHSIESYIQEVTAMEDFYISDGKGMDIESIVVKCTMLAQDSAIQLVVVDYDQKIQSNSNQEEWKEILKHVEALEQMAKTIKCHVILLAQADEQGNPRASKRAKQPASAVLHLYQDGGKFFVKAIKNRFGVTNSELSLEYVADQSFLAEGELIDRSESKAESSGWFNPKALS